MGVHEEKTERVTAVATAPSNVTAEIYASERVDGMYIYIRDGMSWEALPDELIGRFGRRRAAMTLELNPTRKLARVDVNAVIAALYDVGYFLQMPPSLYDNPLEQRQR